MAAPNQTGLPPSDAETDRLLGFYIGSHPDDRGRLLADVLRQDDHWFETTHDFIQWLFPNVERSRFNDAAPTLTPAVIEAFAQQPVLRCNLVASFERFMRFLGLRLIGERVDKAANWNERKTHWFVANTHNSLRITRVLKGLRALGLSSQAAALHECLSQLRASQPDCGIDPTTFRYWSDAVQGRRR